MRKAFLVGLVAAGSLVLGSTAASAAAANHHAAPLTQLANASASAVAPAANQSALPVPATANAQKTRGFSALAGGLIALLLGVGLVVALDDDDGDPASP